MKNLVILHLESLSWQIFYQQQGRLPFLRNILSKSMVLRNFFSSATSSIMAMSDFLYGNNFELDKCESFDDLNKGEDLEDSLLSILENHDYNVTGIGYPLAWRDDINNFKIWNSANVFKWVNNESDFYSTIEKSFSSKKPFMSYVWDVRSHLYYTDAVKDSGKTSLEKIDLGYSCLDSTVSKVFKLLEEKRLLDDTIVIGFGDHGDEFWTHAFNGGFCHSNEPYTDLIWTPAFIYDSDKKFSELDDLVSLIDFKKSCLSTVGIKNKNKFKYSGVDLFSEENQFIYSQNLFTSQSEKSDLNKAFSVTNKNYHLIVSKYGLEMYAYRFDPMNHNNLLNFFDFKNGVLKFVDKSRAHPHFQRFFAKDQVADIVDNFNILVEKLRLMVGAKNDFVRESVTGSFDMGNFDKIRSRAYIW